MRFLGFGFGRSEGEKRSGGDINVSPDQIEGAIKKTLLEMNIGDRIQTPDVSAEGSLRLSAVWRCVTLLSNAVSILPIHLYEKRDGGRIQLDSHPALDVLRKPNGYTTPSFLKKHLMTSCLLWGNGYIQIIRDKMYRPIALQMLHPMTIEPYLSETDTLYYRLNNGKIVENSDIIHLKGLTTNGIKGKSPITVHRENLQLAMYAQEYGSKFYSQGGNMSGVFKHPGDLKDDAYNRLKDGLISQTVGMKNAHIPLLLEGGLTYERISIPPEDAQYIESRKFQKTEIATIFGVPPHMVGDLDRSTNNNIEHQGMEFVTYSLLPYLIDMEEEFNAKLLRADEFSSKAFKFQDKALLRGDAKTRSEYYKNMNFIGTMNANEIRAAEEMNAYEGGDEYFVQLNMQTIENAKHDNRDKKSDGTAQSKTGE